MTLNKTQRDKLLKAIPAIAPQAPVAPPPGAGAQIAAQAPGAPAKPVRTLGNIYSAVQAQAIYNPGQPTPPDPSQSPGANAPQGGGIGNNPQNQTIKQPPAKQMEQGTVGSLQPKESMNGWGRTTNG